MTLKLLNNLKIKYYIIKKITQNYKKYINKFIIYLYSINYKIQNKINKYNKLKMKQYR